MTYAPPRHDFRTFLIVWAAQSLSVIGSGMTGFALNVYLAQVLKIGDLLFAARGQCAVDLFAATAELCELMSPRNSASRLLQRM